MLAGSCRRCELLLLGSAACSHVAGGLCPAHLSSLHFLQPMAQDQDTSRSWPHIWQAALLNVNTDELCSKSRLRTTVPSTPQLRTLPTHITLAALPPSASRDRCCMPSPTSYASRRRRDSASLCLAQQGGLRFERPVPSTPQVTTFMLPRFRELHPLRSDNWRDPPCCENRSLQPAAKRLRLVHRRAPGPGMPPDGFFAQLAHVYMMLGALEPMPSGGHKLQIAAGPFSPVVAVHKNGAYPLLVVCVHCHARAGHTGRWGKLLRTPCIAADVIEEATWRPAAHDVPPAAGSCRRCGQVLRPGHEQRRCPVWEPDAVGAQRERLMLQAGHWYRLSKHFQKLGRMGRAATADAQPVPLNVLGSVTAL